MWVTLSNGKEIHISIGELCHELSFYPKYKINMYDILFGSNSTKEKIIDKCIHKIAKRHKNDQHIIDSKVIAITDELKKRII